MAQNPVPHPTQTLHLHRCTAPGRAVVAIHEDEPGEPPDHSHPGGYGPAVPYAPGPVPESAIWTTLAAMRRERAEADLAVARQALRALNVRHQRLQLLVDALRDAVDGGWPLPPQCAEYAEILSPE